MSEGETGGGEIDPEALRAEVEQIKDAMGIQERYPSAFRMWLVFGVLVFGASLVSQVIHLRDLPGYWYPVTWFAFLSPVWLFQWWRGNHGSRRVSADTKPDIFRQFAAVFSLYVVFVFVLGPVEMEGFASIHVFAFTVGLLGVAYLVTGESLKAYYIRRKDRWAFYLGGGWMFVLAVVTPYVSFLETWGYATFGFAYALHATGSYIVLKE